MIHTEFVFMKLVTMALGLVVASAALRGYYRYGSVPLLYVAIGFVFISAGAGLEGILFEFTSLSLYYSSLVHTSFMAIGIACVLYSIYGGTGARGVKLEKREETW